MLHSVNNISNNVLLLQCVAIFFCIMTVDLCASLNIVQDYGAVVCGKLPDKKASDLEYFDKLAAGLLDSPGI